MIRRIMTDNVFAIMCLKIFHNFRLIYLKLNLFMNISDTSYTLDIMLITVVLRRHTLSQY